MRDRNPQDPRAAGRVDIESGADAARLRAAIEAAGYEVPAASI